MTSSPGIPWSIDEVRAAVLALNDPQRPFSYGIDGDVITARWKFDDPSWTDRLDASDGASRNFRYSVRLAPQRSSFRWFEQDAGIDNGRFRAYRGYNRGVSINLFTLLVGLARRIGRAADSGRTADTPGISTSRDQLSAPLLDLLERAGWKNNGVTV
jgi:hypothetical protein